MKIPLGRLNCVHSVDELAVLIENLDAVVAAVADEQAALGIEGQRVRRVELARPRALLAPLS